MAMAMLVTTVDGIMAVESGGFAAAFMDRSSTPLSSHPVHNFGVNYLRLSKLRSFFFFLFPPQALDNL